MSAWARTYSVVGTATPLKWCPQPRNEERRTSVHEFLTGKGRLDGTGARLSFEDRWMVFSGVVNCWVVFERKSSRQKTKVLYSGSLEEALGFLEIGPERKRERVAFQAAPGLAGT